MTAMGAHAIDAAFDETPDIESSNIDYARRFSGSIGQWFLEVQSAALKRSLEGAEIESVLDVGGGHGQNIELLTNLGCSIEVLGSAPECAKLLSNAIDSGSTSFKVGNILDLPYADNSFDAVISFRMLAHLDNWEQHIAELCRVSRGLVVVDFPVAKSVNALAEKLFFLKKAVESNTRQYQLFGEEQLSEAFIHYNYQQGSRYPQYFFPMALYRALKFTPVARIMEACARLLGLTQVLGSPVIAAYCNKVDSQGST